MGKVIELREYKDNGDNAALFSEQEVLQEVNTAQQLLSFVETAEGHCSLTINLSKSEIAQAIPRLIDRLHNGNPTVQKHILEVLGNMESPEVVPHILPFCFQPDLYLKIQAVKSLELLGEASAILPLKDLLRDSNQQLKRTVIHALKQLIDDEFLLMIVAHDESKPELSSAETFFDLIALFDEEELTKFSSNTIKTLFEFFYKHYQKSRTIEEQLLKKQWEAEAVTENLLTDRRALSKGFSESRLELEIFRKSALSEAEERRLLPEPAEDQSGELEKLRAQFESLLQENEQSQAEITNLRSTIEAFEEQSIQAEAELEPEAEAATEAELPEESSEESLPESFDPGDFTFNEDILEDLFVEIPGQAALNPSPQIDFPGIILMLEQDLASAEFLRSLFHHAGYSQIRIFLDGRLALENIKQHHSEIKLILTSGKIAQMDGLEFLKKIRAFEKEQEGAACPIIAFTEDLNTYKLNELTDAGASEVFSRLFVPEKLIESVGKLTGALEQADEEAEKQHLSQVARQNLSKFCRFHKKRISLAFKYPKTLTGFSVNEENFRALFEKMIEFCVVSAANKSRITLLLKPSDKEDAPAFIIAASFQRSEESPFQFIEAEFKENELFAAGELLEEPAQEEGRPRGIKINLPYQTPGEVREISLETASEEALDDEEVFDLLDELEDEGSNIQEIVNKIQGFCEKEPFRLFSVMDYLHDGHFERAHQEILEMLQKLDRVDIIPYLIRRFQQLHKEYKLWALSFIAEKDIKAGLYFIISVLRDKDEEVRHQALTALLKHFEASFLHLLMHSFVRTFRLPKTLKKSEILRRLPAKERSAFFQILLFNEKFEQSVPFLFGYLQFAAPFEQESVYIALAAQKSLHYLNEEQITVLKDHFEKQQVLQRFPNIAISLLLSTAGEFLEWIMSHIKPIHWIDVFQTRFVEDVKSGWEAMGPFIQEGMQEVLEHFLRAEELLFTGELDEEQEKEVYRMFHMSKGVALSLDLEILVALYHYIESLWSKLSPHVEEKKEEAASLRTNFENLLGVTKKAARIISMADQDDSFLLDKKALNTIFPRLEHLFNKLTSMLKKEAKLTLLEEKVFYFDPAVLSSLNEILIQLLKNSVDHGIEANEKRMGLGKPERGEIQVRIGEKDEQMEITVSDDGQGLNAEKIARRCIEKELLTAEQAAEIMADETKHSELYDYIFIAQFSTAQKASEISGRGVGMDIIRSEVEGMGGSISIKSESGKGSSFVIQIPTS
ncbi:MAG: HEAT repeat domain-containing protein [SAR324 cluster bacterium]|nr:HEAT repeat domain-containing protein [SAR324 cluster bacterium]